MKLASTITFEAFLLKHTSIDRQFVKSFFSFVDYREYKTKCYIPLANIAKWLNVQEGTLRKKLFRRMDDGNVAYTAGVDFVVDDKRIRDRVVGKPQTNILVRPDTYKRLCMQTSTAKARQVRTYFIEVEALLEKYRNQIENSNKAVIADMKKTINPARNSQPQDGVIYGLIVTDRNRTFVKIGKAKQLTKRMLAYDTGTINKTSPDFVHQSNNYEAIEAILKIRFKDRQYRTNKEFYAITIADLARAVTVCEQLYV